MKEKLTKTEERLYKYLKRYDGKVTTEQIAKYMNWVGSDALNYTSRKIHQVENKGWIEIIPQNLRRSIRIVDLDK